MKPNQNNSSSTGMILIIFLLLNAVILEHAFTINENWYWALIITFPPFISAAFLNKKRKMVKKMAN